MVTFVVSTKTYILATINKDWADEFSCQAFAAMPESDWNAIKSDVRKFKGGFGYNFGTNEGWEDLDFNSWIKDIKVKEITKQEYNTLGKLFQPEYRKNHPIVSFGTADRYISEPISEPIDIDADYDDEEDQDEDG